MARYRSLEHVVLPILLMAGIGAAAWQPVRISAEGCGWTMGLIWGLAWLFLSGAHGVHGPRSYGRPWMVLAFVAGFYFGGMHGYGQFHHWIQGRFELSRAAGTAVDISPLYGYGWLFLCGVGWGGVAGVFLVWLGKPAQWDWRHWLLAIALTLGGAWAFSTLAQIRQDLVMPLFGSVNYGNPEACPDCQRTLRTLVESMRWLGFWLGGLLACALLRAWRQAAFILLMGAGFGVAFIAFEWLLLFWREGDKDTTHFWSIWEASVGLLGGAVLGACFLVFNGPPTNTPAPSAPTASAAELLGGLILPLLASLYYVLPFRLARAARWLLDQDEQPLRPLLGYLVLILVLPLGIYGTFRILRNPAFAERLTQLAYSGRLFLAVYLTFFLVSYVPRFGLIGEGIGIWITQTLYGLAFVLSLLAYRRLRGRTHHASS